eukprot:TRINITY_DN6205_c0_g1_i1.p1 TRINITY_DN6205_c0_g1~~TRINITY_DN6205_c0_g1_i1.p1  ORF type:complete len:665 (+),score=178.42 TRINITY_DN6205_c0_g1_i1:196-1995(+)
MPARSLLALLALSAAHVGAQVCPGTPKQIIDALSVPVLRPDGTTTQHNIYEIPQVNAGADPLRVKVTASVTKINEFSTKLQTFKINVYFRHQWVDPRLRWDDLGAVAPYCGTTMIEDIPSSMIWRPDSFFSNSNEIKAPDAEEFVTIKSNGEVLWSKRIVLNLFCSMNFEYYPFDVQECPSTIESYAYSPDKLIYVEPEETDKYQDPIKLLDGVGRVGPYSVDDPIPEITVADIGGNQFAQVKYKWTFHRAKGRFILTNMTQLWLVVAMSFMGLFINVEVAPARVAIALISVLTCMNILNRLLSDIPVVPKITGMDWLYLITSTFVVSNVVEYCLMNYLISCIGASNNKAAEVKKRRHADYPPSARAPTSTCTALARCELKELFGMFDSGGDGVLTRNECCALILSLAADRARTLDKKQLNEAVGTLPRLVTFPDLAGLVLGSNAVAEKVGLAYEPIRAIILFKKAWSKADIMKIEKVYRFWCPMYYIYAQGMWFLNIMTMGNLLVVLLLGIPILIALIVLSLRAVKVAFKEAPVPPTPAGKTYEPPATTPAAAEQPPTSPTNPLGFSQTHGSGTQSPLLAPVSPGMSASGHGTTHSRF